MAIYHLEAKVVSRGSGRSACAASAYMSCSEIYNDYDGVQHDYTRKRGLVWEHVFLPEHAPPEWKDRKVLWNAVESVEKSKDSRLARELVVALPVELDQGSWKELLTEYIQNQFVSEGMCVDTAIHDTDGNNPHAHILMTVRPLTDKGGWQNKTEKEYLCIRNGRERGFTASEFNTARHDGWEKQYPYLVDGKKTYLPPSEAERLGYERADKHPKSTRYGRQNPLTARWNSDEQLVAWRAAWADTVNRSLERHGIEERIDHRSFKERGITEQPTIHEGYIARDLEKMGIKSDRCEINRQIRADNKLLREIRKQVEKLAKAASDIIPAIAGKLETIRSNMIRLWYHVLDNGTEQRYLYDQVEAVEPVIREYRAVNTKLQSKQDDKKDHIQKKKDSGILNPVQLVRLNQQISELTEEIEELKFRRSELQSRLHCDSDQEMKKYESYIGRMSQNLERLEQQRDSLLKEIDIQADQFRETKAGVDPDKSLALMDARLIIRDRIQAKDIEALKDEFGKQFDYTRFQWASENTDQKLGEDPDAFRARGRELSMEQWLHRHLTKAEKTSSLREKQHRLKQGPKQKEAR